MGKDNVFYRLTLAIIFLICMGCSSYVMAQSDSEKGLPFITNYAAKTFKALPQIWCAEEDNGGMMYFGAQNHVLEYDGVKWKKAIRPQGTNAIVIRALKKAEDGTIYFGAYTDFGYLSKDSTGQTIMKSLLHLVPKEYHNFFDVWTIHSTGNSVFFQSREYIFRIDKGKHGNKNDVKVWKPKSKFMYAFYNDEEYYVHQQGLGLYKMGNDSLEFIPGSEFVGQERMQIMLPYPNGQNGEKQWLIGMFYSGLYIYNGKTFRPFNTQVDEILKSGSLLYKGTRLRNGNYVLSTLGTGLLIIDHTGKLLNNINRSVGLQDETVYSILEDKNGVLWLTLDNGISRVDIASPFSQFNLQSGINTSVLAVHRFEGELYVGTSNGLLKYDSINRVFRQFTSIPLTQIFTFLQVGNELFVPCDGLFSIKNKKINVIRSSVSGDMTISGLHNSNKHPEILYAGSQIGVAIFTKDATGKWNFEGHVKGLNEQIWTFSEMNDGRVWAGSQNSVVFRITPGFDENGKFNLQQTTIEEFGPKQNIKNLVGTVLTLNDRTYFNTDSTLMVFDDNRKIFHEDTTFFKKTEGLQSEFIGVEDSKGRVWLRLGKETRLATKNADGSYKIESNRLSSFSDFSFSSFYPDKNDVLWIATTDGLVRYDEKLDVTKNQSFKTILRHISSEKSTLPLIENSKGQASLSFKNNTLRFEYAAPYFDQENKTQYQTWLEGFEDEWTELDNNFYKEYTNLPPGKYTFHVRARNVSGTLSEEAIHSFEILPPWYRTWWAYLLYVVIAAGIVYVLIRWRTKQLHEKHRELEKTVADRTKELSHRVEELAVINSVQDGLVRELDMHGIYNLVGEKIREIFNAQVIDIVTYDKTTNQIADQYTFEKGDRTLLGSRPLKGFRKHVIETGKPLIINKDVNQERARYDQTVIIGEGAKSIVLVPMIAGGEVTGVISLQNLDRENAFTESDVNLLTTLSNSMSVALESARRFDETNRLLKETEQRTAELSVINSVQEGLAKELDMQAIYDLVGERITNVFNAQALIIATLDPETKTEHFNFVIEKGERFYLKPRPYDKLREHLIETRQKILINENFEEAGAKFGMRVLPGTEHPKSLLFVPLVIGDKVKSYVSLQNVDKENAFSDSDVRLLETVANSMSVALENARLFDETNRLLKETEQRTAELAVINSVQEGLAKELDIQGIYELVGDRLCDLFPDTQTLVIRTFNHESGIEHFHYAIEKGVRF
ncbi:MAG TPA: GAF domain-containing protein, partial [Chitinophagaceae bacterium]